jgi:glucosylceramidase
MRFVRLSLAAVAVVLAGTPLLTGQSVQVLETRADGSVLLGQRRIAFTASSPPNGAVAIAVDGSMHLQRMDGFGASLTDSSASLLMQLPPEQRNALMHEIFDPSGPLGLTLLRQPIGASDFSAHGDYSYDDAPNVRPDPSLAHFNTATDGQALWPLLREALHLDPQLRIMALPWSAPAWMKDSHSMHAGSLVESNLPTYAQYLSRTVEAYASEGLPIFALALQNEPLNENATYPTQHMEPAQEAHLAAALRPLLWHNGRDPLLLGYEHNWNNLDYPSKLLAEAARLTPNGSPPLFVGISFHCYAGSESAQLVFLRDHPGAGIWFTECSGTNRTLFADDLLWQARHLLLGAPLNGARSVLFWNLVLSAHGGPHNGGCGDCRALFTVEPHGETWSIRRNVEYYELAHAAPFIHPGSFRIAATPGTGHDLQTVAFQNLDGTLALLVLNPAPREAQLAIQWHGQTALYPAPARSLMTFHWGTPAPVLSEGTYRIALNATGQRCLESEAGTYAPAIHPCSVEPEVNARQLWTLHRLGEGRFEIRNVATSRSIGLAQGGKLTTLVVDGGHVSPLALRLQGDGVCLEASCSDGPADAMTLNAGNLLYLSAP